MGEKLNELDKKYEKEFESLIVAFDWALGSDYLKSVFIQRSIKEDYEEPESEDEMEEVIGTSRADTIGEIYIYAAEFDMPTHYIDEAYEIALDNN